MYNSPILASDAVNTGVHQIALDSLNTDPQGEYFLTLHSCGTMFWPHRVYQDPTDIQDHSRALLAGTGSSSVSQGIYSEQSSPRPIMDTKHKEKNTDTLLSHWYFGSACYHSITSAVLSDR